MSAEREREFLKALYPSKRWAKRVNRMTDAQAVAIYLKKRREIDDEHNKYLHEKEQQADEPDSDIPF